MDGERVRRLEEKIAHLQQDLAAAIALLERNQIPVPEEMRSGANSGACPAAAIDS